MATPQPLFLLLGAGPGIGRSLAKAFAATHHFPRIVLVSRNRSRLAAEKAAVEAAATAAGYNGLQVFTFAVDISDQDALRKVLGKVEHLGEVRCVWHNAASVRFGECLGESGEEVERDWKVGRHFFSPHLCRSLRSSFLPPIIPHTISSFQHHTQV